MAALYPLHPATAIFPMLPDDELKDLAEDISRNGLLHPIVLDDHGRILDGRNRLRACEIGGIEPRFENYSGDDPDAYALSVNLARRHMTKGQRAMVAAKARPILGHAIRDAARSAEVGKSGVNRAAVVLDHAPDLADEVIGGTRSLDDAYNEARDRKRLSEEPEEYRPLVTEGRAIVRGMIDHWTDLAQFCHEVAAQGEDLDEFADRLGEEGWRFKALAEAWGKRDHYTERGWSAALWEIDNRRFEDDDG